MAYALADDTGWVCEDHDDHHGSTASERVSCIAPNAIPTAAVWMKPPRLRPRLMVTIDRRHAELTEPRVWRRLSGNCCYCTTADPVKPEPAPPMILLVP